MYLRMMSLTVNSKQYAKVVVRRMVDKYTQACPIFWCNDELTISLSWLSNCLYVFESWSWRSLCQSTPDTIRMAALYWFLVFWFNPSHSGIIPLIFILWSPKCTNLWDLPPTWSVTAVRSLCDLQISLLVPVRSKPGASFWKNKWLNPLMNPN